MSHAGFAKLIARLVLLTPVVLIAHLSGAVKVDPKAEIHPTAVLMGNVTVGAYTKIGPKVIIQGDVTVGHHVNIFGDVIITGDKLTIGNYVRLDYGAKILKGRPAAAGVGANTVADEQYIKDNCWVGMNAAVMGSRMEEGSAVGSGAVAAFNTHLEKGAVLAHGAITAYDQVIPAGALAEGYPAKVTKAAATDPDRKKVFGVVPIEYMHSENDQVAAAIDKNPPKARLTYPGVAGKQYWTGKLTIDPTAQVHPTAILLGPVTIGAHTRIGPGVVITRAIIGHHCQISADTNIRADTVIGNYVYIGERVHVASSRTNGFDNPLWIKDYSYIGPGSIVHGTKVDDSVYFGANVMTDYGALIQRGAVLANGLMIFHDTRIREEAYAYGNPGLMHRDAGMPDERRMKLLGFVPRKWIDQVLVPSLEKSEIYDEPLPGWEHINKGTVTGKVAPGTYLVGNVNVEVGAKIAAGAYIEGNVTVGKYVSMYPDTMIVSKDVRIGDYTHMYDKAMVVDGRPGDKLHVGIFSWINHLAAIEGANLEDFANTNIGTSAAFGTKVETQALLLNNSATYADQVLPARSISYGTPARVRVENSTMQERMVFFYGRDWPTWERQATAEQLKGHKLPE